MDYADISKLITNCLTGDPAAVERLVHHYQESVFRLALSVLDDPAEASEATQDTFIAALAALESYQHGTSFKNWLYTIALNTSRSRLRKRKTLERLKNTLQGLFRVQHQKPASPEDTVIQSEKDAVLWKALRTLGEKHRIPLVLRYYHDMPVAEIAKILNISEGTIHSRLHVARERLRTELERQAE